MRISIYMLIGLAKVPSTNLFPLCKNCKPLSQYYRRFVHMTADFLAVGIQFARMACASPFRREFVSGTDLATPGHY